MDNAWTFVLVIVLLSRVTSKHVPFSGVQTTEPIALSSTPIKRPRLDLEEALAQDFEEPSSPTTAPTLDDSSYIPDQSQTTLDSTVQS